MTKRELIDQIVSENQTAEPGFLAQFSDEQLQEYLAHLKWLRQPRLSGNPSRFDHYFHNCPTVPAAPGTRPWRTTGDVPGRYQAEAMDLSLPPAKPAPVAPQVAPAPTTVAEPKPLAASPLPRAHPAEFIAPLPADRKALDAMQLTPQERAELTASLEGEYEADEPPAEPEPNRSQQASPTSTPFADTAADEQSWLY